MFKGRRTCFGEDNLTQIQIPSPYTTMLLDGSINSCLNISQFSTGTYTIYVKVFLQGLQKCNNKGLLVIQLIGLFEDVKWSPLDITVTTETGSLCVPVAPASTTSISQQVIFSECTLDFYDQYILIQFAHTYTTLCQISFL